MMNSSNNYNIVKTNSTNTNTVLKLRILFVILVLCVGIQCIWILSNTNNLITTNNDGEDDKIIIIKNNDNHDTTTTTTIRGKDDPSFLYSSLIRSLGFGLSSGIGVGGDSDGGVLLHDTNNDNDNTHIQLSDVTESAALKDIMIRTNQTKSHDIIITTKDRQGFHLPKNLVEWNLPGTTIINNDNNNMTKTICVKSSINFINPPPNEENFFLPRDMFRNTGWNFVRLQNNNNNNNAAQQQSPKAKAKRRYSRLNNNHKRTDGLASRNNNENNNRKDKYNDAEFDCQHSLMRFFYDNVSVDKNSQSSNKIQHLQQHLDGQQLSSSLLGGNIDKDTLATLIEENHQQQPTSATTRMQPPTILMDSIPITRSFDSDESCIEFCNNEWSKAEQEWIWKPKFSFGGNGIMLIGDNSDSSKNNWKKGGVVVCRQQCVESGGEKMQAQILTNSMVIPTNEDGRKFYVRSHIFVANVHPLIVFVGAEYIRICAEPIKWIKDPIEPYPGLSPQSKWNPFQHICNGAIGKKHPTKYSPSHNTGPLSVGIPDDDIRFRVLTKLDDHNRALVDLLFHRWSGGVGMFQLFGADYIVDESEKLWLLEINRQPGFPRTGIDYPNPWGDIFEIEWEILATYNQYQPTVGNSYADGFSDDWEMVLQHKLSHMESGLETLRRLRL